LFSQLSDSHELMVDDPQVPEPAFDMDATIPAFKGLMTLGVALAGMAVFYNMLPDHAQHPANPGADANVILFRDDFDSLLHPNVKTAETGAAAAADEE
jgi:hypothetical protein